MQITKIITEPVRLDLNEPFVTAARGRVHHDTVLVWVETDEGISGVGEASPARHVTGETQDTVLAVIRDLANCLVGTDPLAIETAHAVMDRFIVHNPSAKAGIDIALYDIAAKRAGLPLYALLGGHGKQVETDITLSVQEPADMVAAAEKAIAQGFRILKIKVGVNPDRDIEGIRMVRAAVGEGVVIKLDANQAFTRAQAVAFIDEVKPYGVACIEQPCPRHAVTDMAYVRHKTGFTVVADESVWSPADALGLVVAEACDMVNIKLMKAGGIFRAAQISSICRGAGMACMMGCMLESRVGIAAAAHFAASRGNITDADLDGAILTNAQVPITGGYALENGVLTLSNAPGLGVSVRF